MTPGAHRVLVVDDEFASLEVLALLLKGAGYQVVTASNGEEALERLAESHVDLVLTDYKMPMMDGSELCVRMLADPRYAKIPIIFTSATYRQDVPRPANVRAFFTKPLLFNSLIAAVTRILQDETPP